MHFSIWRRPDGQFYWELVGNAGEVLAVSACCRRKETVETTIVSIQSAAGDADTIDRSQGEPFERQLP